MANITDPDQINEGTEVVTNTTTRRFEIFPGVGNLPNPEDGIVLQALYSWYKEEWKDVANRMRYPFPLEAITPEQMEFRKDWEPIGATTRKAIRTGGWREIDTDSNTKIKREYAGVITLGTFEDDVNDLAYYQIGADPTSTTSTIDFDFAGPVNEPILTYNEVVPADTGTGFAFAASTITRNDGGNWITDGFVVGGQVTVLNAENAGNNGDYVITSLTSTVITVQGTPFTTNAADTTCTFAINYRNAIKVFLRIRDADPNGKTYDSADLASIGVSEVDNKVFRFPLSNATDLDIAETDANISSNSPYTQVTMKYFDQAFSRTIDSATARNFGIVIDVGTWSGVDGSIAPGATLTTAEGGVETYGAGIFTGGTLSVYEGGPSATTYTITGHNDTEIFVTPAFATTESNLSFTAQRSTPITANKNEIYEKVQYFLRQNSDIDSTTNTVVGKTADELLVFVGPDMIAGRNIPINPNGGGSGVLIQGFDSNDTNNLSFYDNTGTERTYPFVAAGTITFNDNLQNDAGPAEYTMYFEYTERFTNTGFGLSSPTGLTATLDSATTNLSTELSDGDFIKLAGFANAANNGLYRVGNSITSSTALVSKVFDISDGNLVAESAGPSVSLDKNPIDSDDAIVVNNNAGAPITGIVAGPSITWDFDYDNNSQGGRTPGTPAAIMVRAIGTNTAQYVRTTGTISQATGTVFSLVAALERNYLNPA